MFYARYKRDWSRFGKILHIETINGEKIYTLSIEFGGQICAKASEFDVLNATSNITHLKSLLKGRRKQNMGTA